MKKKPNTRVTTARILYAVCQKKKSLSEALILQFKQDKLGEQDQKFVQALCYTAIREYDTLQAYVSLVLDKTVKDSLIKQLLLVGICQLSHMNVAEHAAINETVKAAILLKKVWASKLVNAALRRFIKEKKDILKAVETQNIMNHPEWFITQLKHDWPEKAESILGANQDHPPMHLRVNLSQTSRNAYLQKLRDANIDASINPLTSSAITLNKPVNVDILPHFAEGYVSVQDIAAQCAAFVLDPQPGERILDACAAPGGKTCHILEHQTALEQLVALDQNPERLKSISENLSRLNLKATCIAADATQLDTWWDGQLFDRILLDAPCSATGVIRRHPDIKHLRKAEDIQQLSILQSQLLQALWQTLKPGGTLIYATCSVLKAENDQTLATFIGKTENAAICPMTLPLGTQTDFGHQFFPTSNQTDGFYYSKIAKTITS